MQRDPRSHANAPTFTSTSLILRIQANEKEAWERFAYIYAPVIYSWCRKKKLQPTDADDLAQEILRNILLKIDRYDRTGSFKGWLWTMSRNKIIDYFRKQGRTAVAIGGTDHAMNLAEHPGSDELLDDEIDLPEQLSNEDAAMGSEFGRALEFLRNEFEPNTILAFIRMAIDGLTAKEVAAELGWTGSTKKEEANGAKRVRMCKVRILKRLRDEFDGMLDLPK